MNPMVDSKGQYYSRSHLAYRLGTVNFEQEWPAIVEDRKSRAISTPLKDQSGAHLWFYPIESINDLIKTIDFNAKQPLSDQFIDKIKVQQDAWIDESYYSSVIEGAFSTRRQAEIVIRAGLAKNKSEQMILNNYHALNFVLDHLEESITHENFVILHHIVTENTLAPEDIMDQYRTDSVFVRNMADNTVIHEAPDAAQLFALMNDLFNFLANSELHPLLIGSMLHFYIGYVHPFYDGNGRTARAVMYWFLIKRGYDFFRFFSISRHINDLRGRYYQAFLDSEDGTGDITYFLLENLMITDQSIQDTLRTAHRSVRQKEVNKWLENKFGLLTVNQIQFLRFLSKKEEGRAMLTKRILKRWNNDNTAMDEIEELTGMGIIQKNGEKEIVLRHQS
ncbi:MAG: Fic family protein [Bacilli bacterium]